VSTAADFNPYAAPQVIEPASPARLIDPESNSVWRERDRVVIPHGADLPPRCWECNAPADALIRRRPAWFHPAWLLLILLHVFILLLVLLFVTKRADFVIGLCHKHADLRRRHLAIAWLLAVGGFALTVGAAIAYVDSPIPLLTGLAVFVLGLGYGAIFATVCRAKRIDKSAAWISGAGQRFLAELPRYPTEA
jgi:hypothetical protein